MSIAASITKAEKIAAHRVAVEQARGRLASIVAAIAKLQAVSTPAQVKHTACRIHGAAVPAIVVDTADVIAMLLAARTRAQAALNAKLTSAGVAAP